MDSEIRCRIAPSPTGEPHVGTAYIALMNLAFCKKQGGKFILRIEDTDQLRSTKESENNIFESLNWLGLNWDEGPDIGGPYGPYRQSERLSIYSEYIKVLLKSGHAYLCFCTSKELDEMRKTQAEGKQNLGYMGEASKCRKLSEEEINRKLAAGIPYVIRLKVPYEIEKTSFYDQVRKQDISRANNLIDDQVLIKSDGFPTYHFASVVDDHLMKITHVIRGEEWINSTYKHILLYDSFGWTPPKFYHLGLLRNPDANKTKISKRKNPVSLRWFRAAGYYPKALINFLGLMGYSRYREEMSEEEKKNCEVFTLETLKNEFDEKKISSTGPAFDFVKLDDLNFHYVSKLSEEDFYKHLSDRILYLREYFKGFNSHFMDRYLRAEKEITYWSSFIFKQKLAYQKSDFEKTKCDNFKEASDILKDFKNAISKNAEEITSIEHIQDAIKNFLEETKISSKKLHMLLRVAITGSAESLPLYDAMTMLGVYRCIIRCTEASDFVKNCK